MTSPCVAARMKPFTAPGKQHAASFHRDGWLP
jgi:hypothetical protein